LPFPSNLYLVFVLKKWLQLQPHEQVHRLESELEAATGRKNPKAAAKGASSSHGGSKADRQAKQELAEMEEARRAATEQLTVFVCVCGFGCCLL
jgi:hypothetical protein